MNWYHRRLCRSDDWARLVADVIVPDTLGGFDLGDDVLEIGPGYGATTVPLAAHVPRLTALELDPALATSLRARFPAGTGVCVVAGDGADMPFEDARYSGAFCATMLHHVVSADLQDRVFAETCRVLRPGGVFVGSDSQPSWRFRLIHIGDTMVTLNPSTLRARLLHAGFSDATVWGDNGHVRFVARKA